MKTGSRRAAITLLCLAASTAALPALAQNLPDTGVFTVLVENDLFYNADRDYTNGVALFWVPGPRHPPDWATRLARAVPWFPEGGQVGHGYVLGQNMYTPSDTKLADPPPGERPYAGWLYAAVGMGVESGNRLDQVVFTVGVVGPASLAEQSQREVHHVTGSEQPRGWDTQLRNEPGLMVNFQRSWRGLSTRTFAGLEFDLANHVGGALGNVHTYANGGITMRYGKRLALDYGTPRVQPSIQGSGFFRPSDVFSWYAFAGIEGRVVARNIFLDGNTFKDSRGVDKKRFVGDVQWGLVTTWRDFRLSYTHVRRSKEYETQTKSDEFGAFSLSTSF